MVFNPRWTWAAPAAACGIIGVWLLVPDLPFLPLFLIAGLLGGVLAAVHHAEVIALKVGSRLELSSSPFRSRRLKLR